MFTGCVKEIVVNSEPCQMGKFFPKIWTTHIMRKKSKYNHQIGKFLFPDWLTDSVLFKEPLLICLGGGLILGLRTKLHGAVSIVTVVVTDAEPFISFTDFVGRC